MATRVFASTGNMERVIIQDSSTGALKTGLTGSTSGLIISTICDTESTATVYTQAASHIQTISTLGVYAPPSASNCRFKEVDSTNHPGMYEIQLADARYAVSAAQRLIISVTGAGVFSNYQIELYPAPATASAVASLATSFTSLFAKLGSITGTGANTILGYVQAITRKDSTLPSDIGGTFVNNGMSLESFFDNTPALEDFFIVDTTKRYTDAIPGSVVYEIATNAATGGGGGSGLTAQQTCDAVMKLAPTAGSPAAGSLDQLVTAIKARTDTGAQPGDAMNLVSAYNNAKTASQPGDAMALTSTERNSTADALLDRANAVETGLTLRGAIRLMSAALAGKLSGAGTTTITIRNAVADSKPRITATVDTNDNRTAVSTDAT